MSCAQEEHLICVAAALLLETGHFRSNNSVFSVFVLLMGPLGIKTGDQRGIRFKGLVCHWRQLVLQRQLTTRPREELEPSSVHRRIQAYKVALFTILMIKATASRHAHQLLLTVLSGKFNFRHLNIENAFAKVLPVILNTTCNILLLLLNLLQSFGCRIMWKWHRIQERLYDKSLLIISLPQLLTFMFSCQVEILVNEPLTNIEGRSFDSKNFAYVVFVMLVLNRRLGVGQTSQFELVNDGTCPVARTIQARTVHCQDRRKRRRNVVCNSVWVLMRFRFVLGTFEDRIMSVIFHVD